MTATTKIAKERRRKHGDWFWVKKKTYCNIEEVTERNKKKNEYVLYRSMSTV